jgi:hypothetical protein
MFGGAVPNVTADVSAAIKRAEHRANVITSLDEAYATNKSTASSSAGNNKRTIITAKTVISGRTDTVVQPVSKSWTVASSGKDTTVAGSTSAAGNKTFSGDGRNAAKNVPEQGSKRPFAGTQGPLSRRIELVVDTLVGDLTSVQGYMSGQRDYETLVATLENKSIVLDNARAQLDASKSTERRKR